MSYIGAMYAWRMRWIMVVAFAVGCGSESKPAEPSKPKPAEPAATAPAPDPSEAALREPTEELDALTAEMAKIDGDVGVLANDVDAATTDEQRAAAKASLDGITARRGKATDRLTALKPRANELKHSLPDDRARKTAEEIEEKAESLLRDSEALEAKLSKLGGDVQRAQDMADLATAKAKLEQLKREKAEYEKKQKRGR
jgi:hypothetical protein